MSADPDLIQNGYNANAAAYLEQLERSCGKIFDLPTGRSLHVSPGPDLEEEAASRLYTEIDEASQAIHAAGWRAGDLAADYQTVTAEAVRDIRLALIAARSHVKAAEAVLAELEARS